VNILSNVISGGAYAGIHLYPDVSVVTIQGNRIGTNAGGTAALGNGGGAAGVYMEWGIHDVFIIGNQISGNTRTRIRVDDNGLDDNGLNVNHDITIQGNLIGTDVTGNYAVPNGNGILAGGGNIFIGGKVQGAGNLISGNTAYGISVNNSPGSLPVFI